VLFLKTSGKHSKEEAHSHEHIKHETKHETKKEEEKPIDKISKAEDKKLPGSSYLVISTIIIIILVALIIFLLVRKPAGTGTGNGTGTSTTPDKDKVKVEFYVMSQCPYGTQVENAIAPALENLGDAVNFQLDYIVSETSPGVFQSLHGEKEVKGDIVQLCAMKYYPDNYQYVKFIVCQNKDAANVDTNWQACAQENGMDFAKLKTCLEGDEGKNLLRASMQRAQARQASGSPTIFIGDAAYSGQRDSLSFQTAICKFSKSSVCTGLPKCASDADCTEQPTKDGYCINPGKENAACEYREPMKVDYIILNDAKCGTACDPANIVQVTQQLFLGAKSRLVDVNSEEGKALVEKYNITVVPAFIFDKGVEQTKSWINQPDLKTAFELVGDNGDKYKILDEATGATYFVSAEARKAYYDAIGVILSDNKPQIDFFVMSYCPYGNQAEEGVEPVYQLLKDKALFKPHYVIYENYGGGGPNYCIDNNKLCSMHGIQELNQDVRELCANKYMGIGKWFEFVLAMNKACSAANADTCWEAVAKNLGLDVDKIKTCQEKEAVALLTAEKTLGDALKVSGSPTVFVDGDSYSGGRTPEAFKTALCAKFDKAPAECSTKLAGANATTTTAAAAATGGCG
jgi:predicted DsbA family dithiol-disulfide isomerase